jgi:hypothetical protein
MHIVFLKAQQQQNSKLLAQTMLASCATIKKPGKAGHQEG